MFKMNVRVYIDSNGELTMDETRAVFLFRSKGQFVTKADIKRYPKLSRYIEGGELPKGEVKGGKTRGSVEDMQARLEANKTAAEEAAAAALDKKKRKKSESTESTDKKKFKNGGNE